MELNENLVRFAQSDMSDALHSAERAHREDNFSALAEAAWQSFSGGYTALIALGIPEPEAAAATFRNVESLTDPFIYGFKRENSVVEDIQEGDYDTNG